MIKFLIGLTLLLTVSLGFGDNNLSNFYINKAEQSSIQYSSKHQYAVVIDWRLPANQHRLFIVDRKRAKIVYSWYTSHGTNSGDKHRAKKFSNVIGSHQSSLGIMQTAETYYSHKFKGLSLRLDGLQKGLNNNARKRAIVIHPAWYVSEPYLIRNELPGRSHGCITLDPAKSDYIINLIKGGAIIVNIF